MDTKLNKIEPIHPGEILLDDFLIPMGISQYHLAKAIGVQAMRINEIIRRKRSITADTALRLSIYFGNSPRFWLGLQADYDLAIKEDAYGEKLKNEIKSILEHVA